MMNTPRKLDRDANSRQLGKRNRPPISCEPCRIRKLRCNRGSPCETCVKRNKQFACGYANNANRCQPKHSNTGDRLQNLENIVLQFMQNSATETAPQQEKSIVSTPLPGSSFAGDDSTLKDDPGTLHDRGGQINYVDSSHWLSILHDIKEVREQLSSLGIPAAEIQSFGDVGLQPEVDLMFGQLQPPTVDEILLSLPPRSVCDSLISFYVNAKFMIMPIVHPAQFQEEYERFWEDSSRTPILWIGLLFSILELATILRQFANMPTDFGGYAISSKMFRFCTTHCLVLGKYSTGKAYALETLMQHLQNTFLGLADSSSNLWFSMGVIIRLAMRMGYHRDPKNHASITPFEGEMRRRVWAIIYQVDIMMSFQLGLPSMIPSDFCDTEAPRNLIYSDFFPNTAILPPSRPWSDHTPVLFNIIKNSVMGIFRKIVAHAQSLSPPALETTILLDIQMRETYNNLPTNFKMISISRSFMDDSSTIMEKCCIELLYLKGIVVLYRRYLKIAPGEPSNTKYANFRRACVDAAMDILLRQADLHQASQPGGQLHNDQWMISSLASHDFLVAAMVVCLELSLQGRTGTTPRNADFETQCEALRTSHMIWVSRRLESKEAHDAAQALALMIRAVQGDTTEHTTNPSSPQNAVIGLEHYDLPYAEPVMEMIDGSENLDWALIDRYLQDFTPVDTFTGEQGESTFPDMGTD